MTKKTNLILIITWMILIFIMSSFNSIESSNQSNFITNIIAAILKIENVELLSFTVRKLAHFTEYLILGILIHNLIKLYNKNILVSLSICIIYAITDELHQILVPGRTFQINDILIDTIGSFIGITIINLIKKRRLSK